MKIWEYFKRGCILAFLSDVVFAIILLPLVFIIRGYKPSLLILMITAGRYLFVIITMLFLAATCLSWNVFGRLFFGLWRFFNLPVIFVITILIVFFFCVVLGKIYKNLESKIKSKIIRVLITIIIGALIIYLIYLGEEYLLKNICIISF